MLQYDDTEAACWWEDASFPSVRTVGDPLPPLDPDEAADILFRLFLLLFEPLLGDALLGDVDPSSPFIRRNNLDSQLPSSPLCSGDPPLPFFCCADAPPSPPLAHGGRLQDAIITASLGGNKIPAPRLWTCAANRTNDVNRRLHVIHTG